jgi:hypothetical protein
VPDGYITLPSQTYQGYALLRSILQSGSDADFAKAVGYGKRIAFYPLSAAANPPATTYLDAADVVFDATIPYDLRFFESLARMVESQPWLERDRVMIDLLRALGIEKGKPCESLVAEPRPPGQRRRIRRHLLRARGAGEPGIELGANEP